MTSGNNKQTGTTIATRRPSASMMPAVSFTGTDTIANGKPGVVVKPALVNFNEWHYSITGVIPRIYSPLVRGEANPTPAHGVR